MFVLLVSCGPADEPGNSLLVLAASNLQVALPQVVEEFVEQGGPRVQLVFGSTGSLVAQIEQGAPADVLLAANEFFVDRLEGRGLVRPDERRVFARGRLALVTAPRVGRLSSVGQLMSNRIRTVAIANPELAPYGVAAADVLETAGLAELLLPRLVLGESVAQAYQFVSTGNADAGIVALSVVRADPDAAYVIVPRESHRALPQYGVALRSARAPAAAAVFLDFLESEAAQEILSRHGFEAARE